MATTGFRFPTTDAAVQGSWTNATNVQADDGSVAVANIAAKNTTAIREQGGFGFSTAVLPDAATITQVNLRVEWRIQTASSVIAILGVRARVTTTNLTIHENSSEPTTLTLETFDITAERSWAPADFRDGTFKTRLEPRNGNDASDPGYEFDYVAVEVQYTLPTDNLLADDVASGTPTLTSAILGQTHALGADDVATGTPTLTNALLGQTHVLLADDLSAGTPTLTSPTLSIQIDLLADDIVVGTPTLTSVALGQTHTLLADDVDAGTPTLTSASIGQTHVLLGDSLSAGVPTLTGPALSSEYVGEEVATTSQFTNIFRGRVRYPNKRKRWSGKRPQYYWEAAKSEELHNIPLPADPVAQQATIDTTTRLEALWKDLDRRDIKFEAALAEVDYLIHQTTFFLESHRLAQLLEATKRRIETAEDMGEPVEMTTPSEDAEIKELLRFL